MNNPAEAVVLHVIGLEKFKNMACWRREDMKSDLYREIWRFSWIYWDEMRTGVVRAIEVTMPINLNFNVAIYIQYAIENLDPVLPAIAEISLLAHAWHGDYRELGVDDKFNLVAQGRAFGIAPVTILFPPPAWRLVAVKPAKPYQRARL